MGIERGFGDVRCAADHEGDDDLAPFWIGLPDDGHFAHTGVLEQHLLDLARIDVRAAADHDVLGTVAQCEAPALVHEADVAGVEPAIANGLRGGVGIVPIAEAYDIAATDDLAGLAGRQRLAVGFDDGNIDPAARPADRAEHGIVCALMVLHPQAGDRHGRFALTVDLREDGPEHRHRLLQLLDVHGPAAIDDGREIAGPALPPLGLEPDPLHHGRREERAAAWMLVAQVEEFTGIEAGRHRHYLARTAPDKGQDVKPGAVGHRRAMDEAPGLVGRRNVREIRHRHGHQVAMGEHRALGAPGGAAGVEQPGQRIGRRVDGSSRRAAQQLLIVRRSDLDRRRVRSHLVRNCRPQRAGKLRRHEERRRAGVLQDGDDLARVELGVDRDRDLSGGPDAEQDLDIFRPVLAHERDPLALLVAAEPRGDTQRALAQLCKRQATLAPQIDRPMIREPARGPIEQVEHVHPAYAPLAAQAWQRLPCPSSRAL